MVSRTRHVMSCEVLERTAAVSQTFRSQIRMDCAPQLEVAVLLDSTHEPRLGSFGYSFSMREMSLLSGYHPATNARNSWSLVTLTQVKIVPSSAVLPVMKGFRWNRPWSSSLYASSAIRSPSMLGEAMVLVGQHCPHLLSWV